ncbi:MAG: phosphogluconate dehydratase [Burkholderiaceae bacterium]
MIDPRIAKVTERVIERSRPTRERYLARVQAMIEAPDAREGFGCANLAHAWAALPGDARLQIRAERAPTLGVVTAYNEMLSAHAPYARYPELIADEARRHGAIAQVAGGTPAMCDGVTQGTPGMEFSLFSRDVIAQATAVALSHQTFQGALLLGICDKIVPGLLIGALHFGHLPCVFVPAGPMRSGLSNSEKSAVRVAHARGEVGREALQDAELAAYHSVGTCTFYGTANSNQMLLEAMGLHMPNAAFANPGTSEREAFTRAAVRGLLEILPGGERFTPIGRMVDERSIVNAFNALLATGGSTNHLIHFVAVARAAGILIDWTDIDELSHAVPLLARVYPNGKADVNAFEAAGGPGHVIRELIDVGLMHGDAGSIHAHGLREAYGALPPPAQPDEAVLRTALDPFSPHGGLRTLDGNLGRAVIKTSAVDPSRHRIQAPARVFDSQEQMLAEHKAGRLTESMIAVVRFQGPGANGMPELHKLTPALTAMQNDGLTVGLVTDGRMSGASGSVPAAIHVTPEASRGGPLGKVRDGDIIIIDAFDGVLEARVDPAEWAARECQTEGAISPMEMIARDLFAGFRQRALGAEQGACTWM